MAIRSRFSARHKDALSFVGDRGKTKQSMKDECDINNIMARYIKTGTVAHMNRYSGEYGFAPVLEYRDAIEMVRKAQDMFADLPAIVRKRFENDPGKFMEFVQDERNIDEMREMGLARKLETPSPVRVEVVNPPDPEGTVVT